MGQRQEGAVLQGVGQNGAWSPFLRGLWVLFENSSWRKQEGTEDVLSMEPRHFPGLPAVLGQWLWLLQEVQQ